MFLSCIDFAQHRMPRSFFVSLSMMGVINVQGVQLDA